MVKKLFKPVKSISIGPAIVELAKTWTIANSLWCLKLSLGVSFFSWRLMVYHCAWYGFLLCFGFSVFLMISNCMWGCLLVCLGVTMVYHSVGCQGFGVNLQTWALRTSKFVARYVSSISLKTWKIKLNLVYMLCICPCFSSDSLHCLLQYLISPLIQLLCTKHDLKACSLLFEWYKSSKFGWFHQFYIPVEKTSTHHPNLNDILVIHIWMNVDNLCGLQIIHFGVQFYLSVTLPRSEWCWVSWEHVPPAPPLPAGQHCTPHTAGCHCWASTGSTPPVNNKLRHEILMIL